MSQTKSDGISFYLYCVLESKDAVAAMLDLAHAAGSSMEDTAVPFLSVPAYMLMSLYCELNC